MAKIELKLSLKKVDGATDAWMVVDNQDVVIKNGRGVVDVDTGAALHTWVVWVEGPAGSSAAFEIKKGGISLKKDSVKIVEPNRSEVAGGEYLL